MSEDDENWDDDFSLEARTTTTTGTTSSVAASIGGDSSVHSEPDFDDDAAVYAPQLGGPTTTATASTTPSRDAYNPSQQLIVQGMDADCFETEDWDQDFSLATEQPTEGAVEPPPAPLNSFNNPTTTSSDSADEVEDWDVEIFGEVIDRTLPLQSTGISDDVRANEFNFYEQSEVAAVHRLTFPSKTAPKVIRLPKSPTAVSDSTTRIPETRMVEWLMAVVSKCGQHISDSFIMAQMAHDLSTAVPLSDCWCRAVLFHYLEFYREKNVDECRFLLDSFFGELTAYSPHNITLLVADTALQLLSRQAKLCKSWPVLSGTSLTGYELVLQFSPYIRMSLNILQVEVNCHQGLERTAACEASLCSLYAGCKRESDTISLEAGEELILRILTDLQCICLGLSPHTTDEMSDDLSTGDTSSETESVFHKFQQMATDDNLRLAELEKLFLSVPNSFLKAKASYVLCCHYLNDADDSARAEQFAFETVHILDNLLPITPNSPAILTSLGLNALRVLASILKQNHKTLYSIAAHRAVLMNLNYQQKRITADDLLAIAKLCYAEQHLEDATIFYRELLRIYTEQRQANEFTTITLTLCEIYEQSGELSLSTETLLSADKTLYSWMDHDDDQFSDPMKRYQVSVVKHNLVKIRQCCANNYSNGYKFKSAATLLERTLLDRLATLQQVGDLVVTLARCYKRLGQFHEAAALLFCLAQFAEIRFLDDARERFTSGANVDNLVDTIRHIVMPSTHVVILDEQTKLNAYKLMAVVLRSIGQINNGLRLLESRTHVVESARLLYSAGSLYDCTFPYRRYAWQPENTPADSALGSMQHKSTADFTNSPRRKTQPHVSSMEIFQDHKESSPAQLLKMDIELNRMQTAVNFLLNAERLYMSATSGLKCKVRCHNVLMDYLFPRVIMNEKILGHEISRISLAHTPLSELDIETLDRRIFDTATDAVQSCDIMLIVASHLTLSEWAHMKRNNSLSKVYWTSVRDLLWNNFFASSGFVGTHLCGANEKFLKLLKRLVRLLVSYKDSALIRDNIYVIEALIHIEEISSWDNARPDIDPVLSVSLSTQNQKSLPTLAQQHSSSRAGSLSKARSIDSYATTDIGQNESKFSISSLASARASSTAVNATSVIRFNDDPFVSFMFARHMYRRHGKAALPALGHATQLLQNRCRDLQHSADGEDVINFPGRYTCDDIRRQNPCAAKFIYMLDLDTHIAAVVPSLSVIQFYPLMPSHPTVLRPLNEAEQKPKLTEVVKFKAPSAVLKAAEQVRVIIGFDRDAWVCVEMPSICSLEEIEDTLFNHLTIQPKDEADVNAVTFRGNPARVQSMSAEARVALTHIRDLCLSNRESYCLAQSQPNGTYLQLDGKLAVKDVFTAATARVVYYVPSHTTCATAEKNGSEDLLRLDLVAQYTMEALSSDRLETLETYSSRCNSVIARIRTSQQFIKLENALRVFSLDAGMTKSDSVFLVSSRRFQHLPWTCLFQISGLHMRPVPRIFDAVQHSQNQAVNPATETMGSYRFYCPVSSNDSDERRSAFNGSIVQDVLARVGNDYTTPTLDHANAPLSCPLVKFGRKAAAYRTKYPLTKFVDCSVLPSVSFRQVKDSYPIIMLTLHDYCRPSEWVRDALRLPFPATILFVPIPAFKTVQLKLQQQLMASSRRGTAPTAIFSTPLLESGRPAQSKGMMLSTKLESPSPGGGSQPEANSTVIARRAQLCRCLQAIEQSLRLSIPAVDTPHS